MHTFDNEYSIVKLLPDFEDALKWLEKYNINVHNSRMGLYLKEIKKLVQLKSVDGLEAIATASDILFEAIEILEIWSAFKNYHGSGLDARLQKALYGKNLRRDEPSQGSKERDFTFELWMNARISKAKYNVNLKDDADVRATQGNLEIFIECKRPISDDVSVLLRKAFKQLQKKYENNNTIKFRGYVAITFERLCNPKNKLQIVENLAEARSLLFGTVNVIEKSHHSLFESQNKYVHGILTIIRAPLFIKEGSLLICGSWISVSNTRQLSEVEEAELTSFTNSLDENAVSHFFHQSESLL